MSKAEFAKAIGVSPTRVSQLLKDGLPVTADGRIDLVAGKRWVAMNLDTNRREARKPTTAPRGSTSETRNLKLRWEAELRKLEVQKECGTLVNRAMVERTIYERARAERDHWIGAIPRIVNRLAAATDGDAAKLFPIIDGIIRDHLMELAATPLTVLKDA